MKRIFSILIATSLLLLPIRGIGQQGKIREYSYKVEKSFSHDPSAYTQGLFFQDGFLYESTGQYGESSFRKVVLESGEIVYINYYPKRYFIEGSCLHNGIVYVLTWMENTCFVYEAQSMTKLTEFYNPREGWGITSDGKNLILSDGSSTLFFLNPDTFEEQKRIEVTLGKNKLKYLNELEYIDGEIWANVYGTNYIVMIDPSTGEVTGRLDCTGLLPQSLRSANTDVLNGIAWDSEKRFIYLTGKNWPRLFCISLVEKKMGR